LVDSKVYKLSVIKTLPLLEQLIFEYAAREGFIQTVDDTHEEGRGGRAAINPHPKTLRQNTTTTDVCGGA